MEGSRERVRLRGTREGPSGGEVTRKECGGPKGRYRVQERKEMYEGYVKKKRRGGRLGRGKV